MGLAICRVVFHFWVCVDFVVVFYLLIGGVSVCCSSAEFVRWVSPREVRVEIAASESFYIAVADLYPYVVGFVPAEISIQTPPFVVSSILFCPCLGHNRFVPIYTDDVS